MNYSEYKPSKALESYVKCYYTIGHDSNLVTEDHAFATGCIEVMFTVEGNPWEIRVGDTYKNTSGIGLWGQILQPLPFRASGQSQVFGIRFHPSTAAFLLNDDVSMFNDKVLNLSDILGDNIRALHEKLQNSTSTDQRIELVETYLAKRLSERPKVVNKIDLVRKVVDELTMKDFFDNIENVAERHGITSRYLQKVFVQHTGLSPKLMMKINRFQNSMVMMGKKDSSLTSVAYACGYFDQSHFIKEFKSFTGFLPSAFAPQDSTAILASPNK